MSVHVMIGMPMHGREMDAETALMLLSAQTQIHLRGWFMTVQMGHGTHAIHMARNMIAHRFLQSDCTDLFFVDDDISGDPAHLIKLLEYPVDVVSGLYRQKFDEPCFVVHKPIDPATNMALEFERNELTGLIKHDGCGLGFTRIRRVALEKLIEGIKLRNPESWYGEPRFPGEKIWPLFDMGIMDHEHCAEDMWFFKTWNLIGGVSWADPDMRLFHAGRKAFTGVFAEDIKLGRRRRAEAA